MEAPIQVGRSRLDVRAAAVRVAAQQALGDTKRGGLPSGRRNAAPAAPWSSEDNPHLSRSRTGPLLRRWPRGRRPPRANRIRPCGKLCRRCRGARAHSRCWPCSRWRAVAHTCTARLRRRRCRRRLCTGLPGSAGRPAPQANRLLPGGVERLRGPAGRPAGVPGRGEQVGALVRSLPERVPGLSAGLGRRWGARWPSWASTATIRPPARRPSCASSRSATPATRTPTRRSPTTSGPRRTSPRRSSLTAPGTSSTTTSGPMRA